MQAALTTIPTEIKELILSYLSPDSLAAVASTCSALHQPAIDVLWRVLPFHILRLLKTTQVDALLAKYGQFVRIVEPIEDDSVAYMIASRCPNIVAVSSRERSFDVQFDVKFGNSGAISAFSVPIYSPLIQGLAMFGKAEQLQRASLNVSSSKIRASLLRNGPAITKVLWQGFEIANEPELALLRKYHCNSLTAFSVSGSDGLVMGLNHLFDGTVYPNLQCLELNNARYNGKSDSDSDSDSDGIDSESSDIDYSDIDEDEDEDEDVISNENSGDSDIMSMEQEHEEGYDDNSHSVGSYAVRLKSTSAFHFPAFGLTPVTHPNLTSLSVAFNNEFISEYILEEMFQHKWPNIRSLTLRGFSYSRDLALSTLVKQVPNLRHLDMHKVDDIDVINIDEILADAPFLSTLIFRECDVGVMTSNNSCKSFRLESFVMSRGWISFTAIRYLLEHQFMSSININGLVNNHPGLGGYQLTLYGTNVGRGCSVTKPGYIHVISEAQDVHHLAEKVMRRSIAAGHPIFVKHDRLDHPLNWRISANAHTYHKTPW